MDESLLAKEDNLSKGLVCPVMTLLLPNSLEWRNSGRLALVLAPILVFFSCSRIPSQCLGNQNQHYEFSCV